MGLGETQSARDWTLMAGARSRARLAKSNEQAHVEEAVCIRKAVGEPSRPEMCYLFKFIYLKEQQRERERDSTCWLTPSNTCDIQGSARLETGAWNPSGCPTWDRGPSTWATLCFPGALAGSRELDQKYTSETQTGTLMWDAGMVASVLTCCATVLAL